MHFLNRKLLFATTFCPWALQIKLTRWWADSYHQVVSIGARGEKCLIELFRFCYSKSKGPKWAGLKRKKKRQKSILAEHLWRPTRYTETAFPRACAVDSVFELPANSLWVFPQRSLQWHPKTCVVVDIKTPCSKSAVADWTGVLTPRKHILRQAYGIFWCRELCLNERKRGRVLS